MLQSPQRNGKGFLGVLCLALLFGLLAAGLWPFRSPNNAIFRLSGGNGLLYRGYALARSSGPILPGLPGASPCSLEVRLRPAREETSTILAFYTPQDPAQFSLRQSNTDVTLRGFHPSGRVYAEADDVFHRGRLVYLAATFGPRGTKIYADGVLAAQDSSARFSCDDLQGNMILGNSLTQHDSFQGEFLGLAIYDRELSPEQVLNHYRTWTASGLLESAAGERAAALYLLDDGPGRVLRNRIRPEAALYIPEPYRIPKPLFLERPWREFRAEWSYWKDVLINLGGFIPFGFAVRLYWLISTARWASARAVAAGAAVSLVIETLQFYLPTRDSSMTDVLANTLGTAAGALLAARKGPEALEFATNFLRGR